MDIVEKIDNQIEIIKLLKNDTCTKFSLGKPYRNLTEKYSLTVAFLAFVVFTASVPWAGSKLLALLALNAFLISAIIYEVSICIPMVRDMVNATSTHFDGICGRLEESKNVLLSLSQFDRTSLELANLTLENDEKSVDLTVGYFIGAFGKLGIVPAVLAMYTTYTEVLSSALPYKLDVIFMAFIVGLYLGSCTLNFVKIKVSVMRYKIDMALKLLDHADA